MECGELIVFSSRINSKCTSHRGWIEIALESARWKSSAIQNISGYFPCSAFHSILHVHIIHSEFNKYDRRISEYDIHSRTSFTSQLYCSCLWIFQWRWMDLFCFRLAYSLLPTSWKYICMDTEKESCYTVWVCCWEMNRTYGFFQRFRYLSFYLVLFLFYLC